MMEPTCTYDEYTNEDGEKFGRTYHWGKKKSPSVTTILDTYFKHDFTGPAYHHNRRNPHYLWTPYTDDAKLVGSYLHYYMGCDLAEEAGIPPPKFDPEGPFPEDAYYFTKDGERIDRADAYDLQISFWGDFKRLFRPSVVGTGIERFLWHEEGYAGRVDAVLKFDAENLADNIAPFVGDEIKIQNEFRADDVWVIDFKSSKGVYEDYPAQLTAYYNAWNRRMPHQQANRSAVLRINGETGWEFKECSDPQGWAKALSAARNMGML